MAAHAVALYAGWLTAASCVALGLVLAGHGVMGAQAAALAMLALALVIGLGILSARPDSPEYALTLGWALIGVIADNLAPVNCGGAGTLRGGAGPAGRAGDMAAKAPRRLTALAVARRPDRCLRSLEGPGVLRPL